MKKRYLILPILTLLLASNVYAITSNDVTYDNDGTTENLTTTLDNLYSELKKYKTGGSVAANQMLEGATGYSKGELVTGTIKSKGATTYTPGTSNQTIAAGQYLSGAQTIKGDANLVAGNIAKGKSIFGVSGTYTSDANATAANILSGKTAYVNGSKVTGTIASKAATTYTPGTSNQTITAGQYLSGAQTIKGDANLTAANIAAGKTIFGVSGTYTSDANATSSAILSGYTAYVNGSKVTGTHQARHHIPNFIWWDSGHWNDGQAQALRASYTLDADMGITVFLTSNVNDVSVNDEIWNTQVTLDGVVIAPDFSNSLNGGTSAGKVWIFSGKEGQVLSISSLLLGVPVVNKERSMTGYVFGVRDWVSNDGFDTIW